MLSDIKFWYTIHQSKLRIGAIGLLIVLSLLFLLVYLPETMKERQRESYDSVTTGYLIVVKPNKTIYQGARGNEVKITGYDISYKYQVEGKPYTRQRYIGAQMLTSREKGILNYWSDSKEYLIRYRSENPEQSMFGFEP